MRWGLLRWSRRREVDAAHAQAAADEARRQREAVRPLVAELRHRAEENRFGEKMQRALGGGR